jgi:large subunit ribosomal protein L19
MNMQLVKNVGKKFMKKVPVIKPGSTVKVHQRIKEGNKERVQIFEGLVIAINSGSGPDKTFTVRKIVDGVGVEKIFPLYSKNITKIKVTKSSDIRRSKLYYMRKRSGKSARLKEKHLTESEVKMEEIEGIGEEVVAEEKEEKAEKEEKVQKPEKVEEKAEEKPAEAEEKKD